MKDVYSSSVLLRRTRYHSSFRSKFFILRSWPLRELPQECHHEDDLLLRKKFVQTPSCQIAIGHILTPT